MSQCVPNWDLDDPPRPNSQILLSSSIPLSDFDVTELTWENGHLSAHSLNHRRVNKPTPKYPSSETLEAIVNQAKLLVPAPSWKLSTASAIGSCNGAAGKKRPRLTGGEGSGSPDDSLLVTDTFGTDEFAGRGGGTGSPETENTSFGGGGAGSRPLTAVDEQDSACHYRTTSPSGSQRDAAGEDEEKVTERGTIRSTISTKRSRAAAVHNQSERKRRDRINQRMRTLQKLVPNSSKTDKASMLDEVIDYLKQLQAQVQMMSMIGSMPAMMMPMQQFQMSVMAQMAQMQMAQMGMGMGMGMMDMGSLARPTPVGIPPVLPTTSFLPVVGGSWDPSAMQQPNGTVVPDPFSAFITCPTQQPGTMDAYQRMTGMYQQLFQQAPSKNPK